MNTIFVEKGDITRAAVDAIVNAANPVMLGGGGVDGAIHRAAGPALLKACQKTSAVDGVRCPTGQCRITEAGNLNAKFVIHTVGPRYLIDPDPPGLLASCYRNSLDMALEYHCDSIAFPAISCGIYGYPISAAAEIAVRECRKSEFARLKIYFYLFGEETYQAWKQRL